MEVTSAIEEQAQPVSTSTELERLARENAGLRAELQRRADAEAILRTSEARFRRLAEAMPQFVWTCDGEGRCDYLGPQWVAYTGIPEANQLGYAWLDNVHADDRARVSEEWSKSANAGSAFDADFRIRRADGAYRWFKTRALPWHGNDGRIIQWLGTNTDIEDRHQAELKVRELTQGLELQVRARTAELEAVSERLRAATSAARIGLWDWDVVHDKLVWDERMYDLYGLNSADFSGAVEAWERAVHPDDAPTTLNAIQEALAGTKGFNIAFRVRTPSGEIRHIRAASSVFRDAAGKPLRMLGANWDVSAEVAAKERLALAEERWDLALQGTGDGVWDWDMAKNQLYLSQRSRELLGYDPLAVPGAEASDALETLVHPEDQALVAAAMDRHTRGEAEFYEAEYRRLCADGSYRWLLARGRIVARDMEGKPRRMVGTHRDVAERRLAQETLKNKEALLREFITHTPAAIAMLDREMRYIQASRRWLTDYKLGDQEIIGRCHYDVFPDIPEHWKEIHQRVLSGKVEGCLEDPFPRADGGMDWLQWEARPWHDADGTIGGVVFFTQVITERKLLGIQLEVQNRQLAASNAELEQFAYVASHDLQEPLRAVAGCTQILAQRYRGKLDPDADVLVGHIVDGAARMKALIEDLLGLSRVNSQTELREQVDSQAAFQRAVTNLKGSIAESAAQISAGELPHVRGDVTQLVQVFQNLVGNALKYRRADRPPEVSITAVRSGAFHEFSVRDNGIGIEPAYFERIFGVFQRLHTRDEYPGTGIGLAICRKIVERHGGRIWVDSAAGGGSSFHFTLPS